MDELDLHGTAWARLLRGAGYVAAGGFLLTTVLYLLDAMDVLSASPDLHRTGRGRLADEATYFAAFFNHQHAIWWDIAARDTLGPVAVLSLAVVGVCLANLWGWRRPAMQLAVCALWFGAVLATLNSLLYLGELNYWRYGGWSGQPAFEMVAIARSAEGIDHLTVYPDAFGYLLIAGGILLLTRLGRAHQLGTAFVGLGCVETGCLLGLVFCSVAGADLAYDLFAVSAGVLIGPAFLISLVRAVGGRARVPSSAYRSTNQ